MKSISSRDNPQYKRWKSLTSSPVQRRRSGQILLEGLHLCQAWVQRFGKPQVMLATERSMLDPEVRQLADASEDLVLLADALFEQLSEVVSGVHVAFVVDVPVNSVPPLLQSDCVVLDSVQDAGNVGSILRSAAAAGVRDVLCTPGTASVWSPKVLRAGMGAQLQLNIEEGVQTSDVIERVRVPMLATSSHTAMSLFDADLSMARCWVFGNEGAGVSSTLLSVAQGVRIPQPGGMESLNVAAAAAICLFEAVRQRARLP